MSLISLCKQLEDPRIDRNKEHSLEVIVYIALCAVICGSESWNEIERFGNCKLDFFKRRFPDLEKIPSHDTFNRFFSLLKPGYFELVFRDWVSELCGKYQGVVINSINRKYGINYPILYYLEDYLTHISTFKPTFKKEHQDLLNEIVTSEQVDKPFDGVPEEEKRLLININSSIKSQNFDAISYNLHELGTVLSTRNRIHSRNAKINQWSIPLAIVGLLATIAFGYLSLQGINYEKIKDINKEAIEEVIVSKDSIH